MNTPDSSDESIPADSFELLYHEIWKLEGKTHHLRSQVDKVELDGEIIQDITQLLQRANLKVLKAIYKVKHFSQDSSE